MLVAGMLSAYSWQWVPAGAVADVWNIATHAHALWLLLLVGLFAHDREVWGVVALLAAWQVLAAAGSVWWLIDPAQVDPQDEALSTRLGLPLGMIGLAGVAYLAGAILKERPRGP